MKQTSLNLIPKYENYMQYIIEIIIKLPRTEKFSIGTEYKKSMYETIESILYIEKVDKYKRLYYLNLIDAKINVQRIYLRIMLKNRWIDEKKFKVAINKIYEIGKILGGLIRHYGKNNKEPIL